MASSLYDTAMQTAAGNIAKSKKRMSTSTNELMSWIDTLDSLGGDVNSGPSTPVGNRGSSKSVQQGISNKLRAQGSSMGLPSTGPSSGAIPELMNYKWRDPIDNQLFHLTTERGTKKYFKPFLNALAAEGYDVDSLGTYANRNARGSNRLSEHAYGRAMDINPGSNPMGSSLQTDLPANIEKLAALYHLIWGGTWHLS